MLLNKGALQQQQEWMTVKSMGRGCLQGTGACDDADAALVLIGRWRHSACREGKLVYVFGGLDRAGTNG